MPGPARVGRDRAAVRVLVADDSTTARRVLERALRELGHECVVAEDGEEAWELFEQARADVVISDWVMPGIDGDELCRRIRAADPYAYFVMVTKLEDREHLIQGMEAGADDYLTKPVDPDALAARMIVAERITGLYRRLAEQQRELEGLNQELFRQARRDPLLGQVGNRLSMREDLERVERRVARYGHAYAIALCDIDRFKPYNDAAGHIAGDDVLRAVAGSLVANCRREDAVYRYGGEELLVLLAEQDVESAVVAAERMRAAVESLGIAHPGLDPPGVVTISIGVAGGRGTDDGGVDATLTRADAALYRAKQGGRNRVEAEAGRG
jgi:two-component system cell cycle response regulator